MSLFSVINTLRFTRKAHLVDKLCQQIISKSCMEIIECFEGTGALTTPRSPWLNAQKRLSGTTETGTEKRLIIFLADC